MCLFAISPAEVVDHPVRDIEMVRLRRTIDGFFSVPSTRAFPDLAAPCRDFCDGSESAGPLDRIGPCSSNLCHRSLTIPWPMNQTRPLVRPNANRGSSTPTLAFQTQVTGMLAIRQRLDCRQKVRRASRIRVSARDHWAPSSATAAVPWRLSTVPGILFFDPPLLTLRMTHTAKPSSSSIRTSVLGVACS